MRIREGERERNHLKSGLEWVCGPQGFWGVEGFGLEINNGTVPMNLLSSKLQTPRLTNPTDNSQKRIHSQK